MIFFKQIISFFVDVLFPIECIGCGDASHHLCMRCISMIPLLTRDFCFVCSRFSFQSRVHSVCSEKTYLDGVISATHWHNPLIKKSLHLLKYASVSDLIPPLTRIMQRRLRAHDYVSSLINDSQTLLVPIPLHTRKKRIRGFNQATLLAQGIASSQKQIAPQLLRKEFFTPPQAKATSRTHRLMQIQNTFGISPSSQSLVESKNIILIDDVYTTGGTLNECARLLKTMGAREVWGVTLAHG